jgi:hypothetical protein
MFAAHDIEVEILQLLPNWANFASANRSAVDFNDGGNLCSGAAQEDLIGDIKFGAVNAPFAGNES